MPSFKNYCVVTSLLKIFWVLPCFCMGFQNDTDYQWFVNTGNKVCSNELCVFVSAAVISVKEKSNFSCFHWPEKWNLAVSGWISFVRKGPKLGLFGGQFAIQLRQGMFILSHPYGSLCHGLLCCVTKLSLTCWSAHCQPHCCPSHCGNNDGVCNVFPFFINFSFSVPCNGFCILT